MGVIAAGAAAIGTAIASAAAAVASVVATVVAAIASAFSFVTAGIVGAIDAIAGATLVVEAGTGAVAFGPVASVVSQVMAIDVAAYTLVAGAVSAIGAGVKAFTSAIHLKTLLKINDIAYILSNDYRQMMNSVYSRISEMSEAIYGNGYVVMLALENARSIVLDVQSTLGKRFDIAESSWLKEMNRFLRRWQNKIQRISEPVNQYRNNPALLLNDLSNWIIDPQITTKANSQLALFQSIENTVEVLETTVNDVNVLREDVTQFVSDLPGEIREDIMPYVEEVNTKIDQFIDESYEPVINQINDVINTVRGQQDRHRQNISNIVDRLTRPGDILSGVDNLSIEQRYEQEDKISEVVQRPAIRQTEDLEGQSTPAIERIAALREALAQSREAPEILRIEPRRASIGRKQQVETGKTWFVGDY